MRTGKLLLFAILMMPFCAMAAGGAGIGQWEVFETSFETAKQYTNAFVEIEVNVVFSQGDRKWVVPAFWAGDKKWTVRFAPPAQGEYKYRVECTDKTNTELNGKEKSLSVAAYQGDNPLLKHGFVKASPGKHYFEHADGMPFLWLADTWWKCLCKRMTWEGFQELTADRKAKGFSVVQIVCGPYPDENFFAPSLENEGGQPYLAKDMSVLNPQYFEYADRRFKHLVDAGIVPAIVGAWGRGDCNSMEAFGAANLKRHWRYLIARYGAYPVMWILAGEIADETKWGIGPWAEVAKYVREIDPYKHPLTCHTGQGRRGAEGDVCLIDYDMVGGNHDEQVAVGNGTLDLLTSACAKKPAMPVLCGETCYEGHMQQGFGDVQRRIFWRNMLSGAGGHTYGAAGVWHASVEGDHGNWGAWDRQPYDWTTWKEGMHYPGSTQLGIGKRLLEKYPWWRFEPRPDWAPGCFAAGVPGEVRFVYQPRRSIYNWDGFAVAGLEPDVDWHAYYFDPATGRKFDQGTIKATAKPGDKTATPVTFKKNVPSPQDWVLVLERVNGEPAHGKAERERSMSGSRTVPAGGIEPYPDNRPAARFRMEARDQGVVMRHGSGPNQCDVLGARDVWIFESGGTYYMHYDGAGPQGWLCCLATSKDLLNWTPKGPILDFGTQGEEDSASASYGVTYLDGKTWHMFYLGTPHASPPPDRVPSFPYLTMKAKSDSPAGPWVKQKEVVPFRTKPGTYYADTASPGHIIKQGDEYMMFFSASMKRTLGIARTKDLNGPWALDPQPIVPPEEQVENSSLYFEPSNKTWFLFTNHIGLEGFEYTDAVWVYWTKDLNKWDPAHKAVVLDGKNCSWSRKCIGLPSVVKIGNRLAVLYDAPGGDSKSHMKRDIGLAWLDLPLVPVE